MLSETEIEERAKYCCCVFLQLSWLYSNDFIEPQQYLEHLGKSSLELGNDQFIRQSIEEALMENRPDGGLISLISLYEGFAGAFCQVLERDVDEIRSEISTDFLRQLADEMGAEAHFE
ncbi:MAG: hypothetical protein AB9866_22595 [Syntrophobacteraceae bacterium]